MVFYFTSDVTGEPVQLLVGEDKYENEELIKWGHQDLVWFHVDKLSSAHIYLELKKGETIEDIPQELIDDCVQLVKANSIQGNKMNNIDVVYTMWSNLKKTNDMVAGQVSFHDDRLVKKVKCEKRINAIVNRLNKTKTERKKVDFREEKERRDAEERVKLRQIEKERIIQLEQEKKERQELAKQKSYDTVFANATNVTTNKDTIEDLEDDFM